MRSPLAKLTAKLDRTAVLAVSGFGLLTASAWTTFGLGAGLAAAGVSALLVELLGGDSR